MKNILHLLPLLLQWTFIKTLILDPMQFLILTMVEIARKYLILVVSLAKYIHIRIEKKQKLGGKGI